MTVMSVAKRGNQHFYLCTQLAQMIQFYLLKTRVPHSRAESNNNWHERLCFGENFLAKELFQTSWRKVFLAGSAANCELRTMLDKNPTEWDIYTELPSNFEHNFVFIYCLVKGCSLIKRYKRNFFISCGRWVNFCNFLHFFPQSKLILSFQQNIKRNNQNYFSCDICFAMLDNK